MPFGFYNYVVATTTDYDPSGALTMTHVFRLDLLPIEILILALITWALGNVVILFIYLKIKKYVNKLFGGDREISDSDGATNKLPGDVGAVRSNPDPGHRSGRGVEPNRRGT